MGELIFLNSDKYIAKKVAGTPKRSIFAADYYAIIRLITFKKKVFKCLYEQKKSVNLQPLIKKIKQNEF